VSRSLANQEYAATLSQNSLVRFRSSHATGHRPTRNATSPPQSAGLASSMESGEFLFNDFAKRKRGRR
jgi:hypothetical protein